MKFCILVGTRPEIIKMAPVMRYCEDYKLDYFILHTGQHYSPKMDAVFFDDLKLTKPKHNLHVGSHPYRIQLGLMINKISEVLEDEKPDYIIVQGDTTSVLAGAIAGKLKGVKIAHHEAGLRSNDLAMLEEINRILVDKLADFLFYPSEQAKQNLLAEGFPEERMFYSGNTIVDAVLQNIELAKQKRNLITNNKLRENQFVLLTLHRAENVDYPDRLSVIIEALNEVANNNKHLDFLFPMHPRTKNKLDQFGLALSDRITIVEPLGYLDFLALQKSCKVIITDSGGLQEEASILRKPCVTIRTTTERPETIEAGINYLTYIDKENIIKGFNLMANKQMIWKNLYGDGNAAEIIMQQLMNMP